MAVQIITDGDLEVGGAVMEASGGTKLAFLTPTLGVGLWSDIDGTPNLEDSSGSAEINGSNGAAELGYIHAAIDSNDDIHVVSVSHVHCSDNILRISTG